MDSFMEQASYSIRITDRYCLFLLPKTGSRYILPNQLQRWGIILLNYDIEIEFLPSEKLGYADELSSLILKPRKALVETVRATLKFKKEIKSVLSNTIQTLPVTIEQTLCKEKNNKYITEKKKQTIDLQHKKIDGENTFSFCDGILMYDERLVMPGALKKEY